METLPEPVWHSLRAAHEARVQPWIAPRLERMSLREKHPVEDFLFEYYSYRPGQLQRWHPGVGVAMEGESARDYLIHKGYVETLHGITADPRTLPEHRVTAVKWLRDMLIRAQERPAVFGCFGLHEWAMVYRSETVRHEKWPLRFSPEETARVVESLPLRCTHYDAFRFFTPAAQPLNRLQPTRSTTADFEQTGCLHANMDLYKWSIKLAPFTPAELVADAFELARDIRTLDMRASPYDFTAMGYTPVPIETPAGREEYETEQRAFAVRAQPLRRRLLALCEQILASCEAAKFV